MDRLFTGTNMTARFPPLSQLLARIRQAWLRDSIADFHTGLAAQGFKTPIMRAYTRHLSAFGEFIERHEIRDPSHIVDLIESFVRPMHPVKKQKRWRMFLTRFAYFVSPPQIPSVGDSAATLDPQTQLVDEYAAFLRDHRGLKHKSIERISRASKALLAFIADGSSFDLTMIRPERIHEFILTDARRYSRQVLHTRCCAIRGFLTHLYRHGGLAVDLSAVVISPRIYKHEQCPRFLTRNEVNAVLAAIDRQTTSGKRSYAMLLLLATYGLRGNEVKSLRLDDIDWRNDRLRIANRKAGNSTDYPLAASIGEAILDYLKYSRPSSTHREVFLTTIAPIKPLAGNSPIAYQVRKHLTLAGITIKHPGTHCFRYSCAQRLLESGAPLKTIGDYLGHTHPDSTQRYLKIAIDQLREVALSDVEEAL